jgi:hypothetical protein
MLATILIFSWVLIAGVTRLLSANMDKIIGDTMFNLYLIPYGILFFISSPIYIALHFVLGEELVHNIKHLREWREFELNNIKALRDWALAEMMEDEGPE